FVLAPPRRWWLFCHPQPATTAAAAGKLSLWWLRWRLVLVVARRWSSFGGVVVPAVKRQRGCGDGGGWCSGDDGVAVHGRDMVEQADWRDDTNDEPDDQELEAHYLYMAHIQEVTPNATDNSGPIFNDEPLKNIQNNDDNYNVFAIESEHPKQPESGNDTYPVKQDEHNIIIDSLDMSYDREQDVQDDNDDLAKECDFLASLIGKLKCKIDDNKNRNKFLGTSNKALFYKSKGEIEDFKNINKSLELSNSHFKEGNNELSKTNQLTFKDLKKLKRILVHSRS
nr:hypothetical protein [Tanacetum cinerariifolium]